MCMIQFILSGFQCLYWIMLSLSLKVLAGWVVHLRSARATTNYENESKFVQIYISKNQSGSSDRYFDRVCGVLRSRASLASSAGHMTWNQVLGNTKSYLKVFNYLVVWDELKALMQFVLLFPKIVEVNITCGHLIEGFYVSPTNYNYD
jgi:hypothetical protein